MGVYDRDYMRDEPPSRVLPNLFWLGLALAIGLICLAVGYRLLHEETPQNPGEPREKVKMKRVKRFAIASDTSSYCSTATECYNAG